MQATATTTETAGLDRRQVRHLQEERLRVQLEYVQQHSTFYRQKFADAGIDFPAIRSIADLAALPFTEKSELRESQLTTPPLGDHAAAALRDVVRVHASSGTTGRPSYVGVTAKDADAWAEVAARIYRCQGVTEDDVVIHGLALGFFVGGLPLAEGVQRTGATFVPVGIGATDRLVQSARDLGATVLSCTPSFARYLIDYMRNRLGEDPRTLGFRRILVGAEPGGSIPSVRQEIESAFRAEVYESVGNADVLPVYSAMCGEFDGNHLLAEDHVIFELIDPDTGNVMDWVDGAEGELVTTHLARQCVPLIRFRTRDRVRVRAGLCPCGRQSPRITCIGRTDDLLIVNGVNVWPSAISDVVASMSPRTTGVFEILLSQTPPLVEPPVHLRVEHGGTEDPGSLKTDLERELRDRLIARCEVELVPRGTLERSEGKTRLIRVQAATDTGERA
ncbi:phenylacetate--CoA ligase family protein [Paenarthrobacter aurescens]|uniref:phenylacetate--CoA ligase family protein n=1 Tax=Paenarthrobacter aurescens TaxID=43663 RepID=UPI0021C0470B|nr:AMP-binding protein [Paenarthrobacter aurescens]MCT9870416.1 AMP-binding protein [Paenarthrobacter aurescens]